MPRGGSLACSRWRPWSHICGESGDFKSYVGKAGGDIPVKAELGSVRSRTSPFLQIASLNHLPKSIYSKLMLYGDHDGKERVDELVAILLGRNQDVGRWPQQK
jgi:hypothetical protein